MDRIQRKSIDQKLKNLEQLRDKSVYSKGAIIAILIAMTPFIFNLHTSVPEVKIWDTFLFTYDSRYYEDVSVIAWTLMNKLIPLMLIFIWFFTNRHWWYHALLVPISMYIYQIIITLNSDLYFVDGREYLFLLPVMAIIIPSIYLIRAKMFDKINNANKTMEELEEEFMIKPTTVWGKVKQYF